MFLVFLGAPGAGKGTQAAIISRKLGLAHVASGLTWIKGLWFLMK
jgi:adenylate kinase